MMSMLTAKSQTGLTQRLVGALAILLLFQFYLYWKHLAQLSDSRTSLDAEVGELHRRRDALLMEVARLERDHHRLAIRLTDVEGQFGGPMNARSRAGATIYRPPIGERILILFVTPTYRRPAQKADLVRLTQTLTNVPDLFWIVAEDADRPSHTIDALLSQKGFSRFAHICARTPVAYRHNITGGPDWRFPKGVAQRNAAIDWIRNNFGSLRRGVVYFGDDDNVYDWRIFEEMRTIQRVGVWPVGLAGESLVEAPILDPKTLLVTGFHSTWKQDRPFALDMAAFALNVTLLLKTPEAKFTYDVPRGHQESHLLGTALALTKADLEPKAELGTRVYVWHTKTPRPVLTRAQWLRFHAAAAVVDQYSSESEPLLTVVERDAIE